ncbi:MAG: carbon-nitrogen hydrolase family protein [Anaerolineae bacterium]
MRLRVVGAQIPVTEDIGRNAEAIRRALRYAGERGADFLLTPEGALSGYRPDFDLGEVREALDTVTAEAREAGVGLALGTCFVEDDGECYNELRFYRSDGVFLGFHAKHLRCGTLESSPEGEINDYGVRPLRLFDLGGLWAGGLICNDLWANPECTPMHDPHLTQRLAQMGARVVFHAVNGGRDGGPWSEVAWRYHEANLRMRARAGDLWIVTVDSCHPVTLPCSAPSGVINPQGAWVCQAPVQGEHFFVHTVEL